MKIEEYIDYIEQPINLMLHNDVGNNRSNSAHASFVIMVVRSGV